MLGRSRRWHILFLTASAALAASVAAVRVSSNPSDYRFPMGGREFLLAGTFGELRGNHFHSGIDIKTGGGIGQPLYAVRDGYVYRIKVSPFGFGKAVYLRHADGEFSVYGHMNGFSPPIEAIAYQKQVAAEQYEQEIYLDEGVMPVHSGDLIGYSGNTGSSAGPHLHFEIRDPEERIMNPLNYYRSFVADHKKPEVSAIAFEPITSSSLVNGRHDKLILAPQGNEGEYTITETIRLTGRVGLEYDGLDRLDGAPNSCGINYARLYLDDSLIYAFALEKFSFDDKKYINVHFDYQHFKATGKRFQRSYIEPGNQILCYPDRNLRGWIELHDDRVHHLRLELADGYRNTTQVRANVQRAAPPAIPESAKGGTDQHLRYGIHRNTCVLRLHNPVARQLKGLTVTASDGTSQNLPASYLDGPDAVFLLNLNQDPVPVSVGDPITGHRVDLPLRQRILPYQDNLVQEGELQLFFPAGCVFDTLPLHLERMSSSAVTIGDRFEIGRVDQPIFKSLVLQFQPVTSIDPNHLLIARRSGSGWTYVGNEHKPDGSIAASTGDFGTFAVMADSTAPTVKPLNFKEGAVIPSSQKTLSLEINDDFSGIASTRIRCTLDGKWALFEYDAKSHTILHKIVSRPNSIHRLEVAIHDQVGNTKQVSYNLTF